MQKRIRDSVRRSVVTAVGKSTRLGQIKFGHFLRNEHAHHAETAVHTKGDMTHPQICKLKVILLGEIIIVLLNNIVSQNNNGDQ